MKRRPELRVVKAKEPSKKEKIIAEATRQFNGRGYYDTRLEDIAAQLGTVKTSISYHFKSKDSLLAEVYSRACDFAESSLAEAQAEPNGLERIIAYMRAQLEKHATTIIEDTPPLALMNDMSGLNEADSERIGARYQSHIRSFKTFLTEGIADGSVDVISVDASTFFAFNAIQSTPPWLNALPERSLDAAIDGFCDLMRHGFRAGNKILPALRTTRDHSASIPDIFDRNARNKLKQDAILRTGIRYLNRRGYRNLSLEDIAAELGVTRGAFYYQIDDKESFLVESFNRTCGLIENALERSSSLDSEAVALLRIERIVRWLFEDHVTELDPLVRLNLAQLLDKPRQIALNARLRRLRAIFAELIAEGMLDGSIRTLDVESAEYIVFGSVFAASGRRFAATQLNETWQPHLEPVSASAAYFETLMSGFAKH